MVISLVHADEQQMVAVVRSRRAEIFAIAINFSLISQSNDLFLLLRSFYLKRQLEELIFQSNFPEIRNSANSCKDVKELKKKRAVYTRIQ